MTDTNTGQPDSLTPDNGSDAGVKRPDQGGANPPGKEPAAPATGGEGAAGAGGPAGFGTGK